VPVGSPHEVQIGTFSPWSIWPLVSKLGGQHRNDTLLTSLIRLPTISNSIVTFCNKAYTWLEIKNMQR
jgi:hypothetical protein